MKKCVPYAIYCVYFFFCLEIGLRLALPFLRPALSGGLTVAEPLWRMYFLENRKKDKSFQSGNVGLPDPYRGWRSRPNMRCNALNLPCATTNSHGIRDEREFSYDKTPGKPRIEFYGDSFTFGWEVGDSETYVSEVQRKMPRFEVMNFGVCGYGHDQMLLYLQEEGVKYKPDVVVLGFIDLDEIRNMSAFRDYAKPKFRVEDGRLVLTHVPVPPPEYFESSEVYRSKLFDLFYSVYYGIYQHRPSYAAELKSVTTTILKEFANRARMVGARPFFVHLPLRYDYLLFKNGYWEPKKSARDLSPISDNFTDSCREARVECMSVLPALYERMRKNPEIARQIKTGHYSPAENKIVGDEIASFLQRRLK